MNKVLISYHLSFKKYQTKPIDAKLSYFSKEDVMNVIILAKVKIIPGWRFGQILNFLILPLILGTLVLVFGIIQIIFRKLSGSSSVTRNSIIVWKCLILWKDQIEKNILQLNHTSLVYMCLFLIGVCTLYCTCGTVFSASASGSISTSPSFSCFRVRGFFWLNSRAVGVKLAIWRNENLVEFFSN